MNNKLTVTEAKPAKSRLDYGFATRHDPRRLPTWRYERVQYLISSGKPPHPRRDDKLIRVLRNFYMDQRRWQEKLDDDIELQIQLAAKYRYLWEADRIFFGGRSDRTRFGVESMILARQPDEEIAESCGTTPEAIELYEQIFFNVRDKLDNRNYIASKVLLDAFMSGLSNRTHESTAKYFGYFGGPIILKLVLDGVDNSTVIPTEPSDTTTWLDHQYRRLMRTIANIGLTYTQPTNFNIRTVIEGYQALLSLDYREQTSRGEDNPIRQALHMLLSVKPAPKGDEADKLPKRPGDVYAGGYVEPRVHELDAASRGATVEALDQYDETWNPSDVGTSHATPRDLG